ncbi:MAG: hypothetical protein V3U11_04955, partial [Planctomycetota bacterium]
MKRILLEILGGLTVLVLLASFHQQIAKLKMQHKEVATLKLMVEDLSEDAGSRAAAAASMRMQITAQIEAKMADKLKRLEEQVARARQNTKEAEELKEQLVAARRQSALIKAQFAKDLRSTRDLVDGYHRQLRGALEQSRVPLKDLEQTRNQLAELEGWVRPDHKMLTEQMLAPSVQLNGEDTVGSGTLIYSHKDQKTGEVESYVLTAFHVVRNILADTPKARREGIAITIYQEDRRIEVRGDLVANKRSIDVALLKLRGKSLYNYAAKVLSEEQADRV